MAALTVAVWVLFADRAPAQGTYRVSVDSAGLQSDGESGEPSISADARFVAFTSLAANLRPGDTTGYWDVFVHDRESGETSCVSVNSAGIAGSGDSRGPSISADGRYVAFQSFAGNLVPGDVNGAADVFVHDRQTGVTSRVSVSSTGAPGNAASKNPSISANGQWVAFSSLASNFALGDTNALWDVFVHDRSFGDTTCVSVDSAGNTGDRNSEDVSISALGRFVAFSSGSGLFVPGDTNGFSDVFVHDRATRETTRVSVDSFGVQGDSASQTPTISADGRFIAFQSYAANLVPSDSNGTWDAFVHDRETGETVCASVDPAGVPGDSWSQFPAISAFGRYVAFESRSSNLVTGGDRYYYQDIFVHDLRTRATSRASVDGSGLEVNGPSSGASVSADGRRVAFKSFAKRLVPDDTNDQFDVFVRDESDCRAGNVNGGAGEVEDVLFVNDSAGGPERLVTLATYQPLTIFMAAPPAAAGGARFALFAWSVVPVSGNPAFNLPFAIGDTCLPTPLTGGSPAPRVLWNNTGSSLLGVPNRPSSPAPSIVVRLPLGLGRPGRAFLQGIIHDRGAPNGRAAVTNGVTIEIR